MAIYKPGLALLCTLGLGGCNSVLPPASDTLNTLEADLQQHYGYLMQLEPDLSEKRRDERVADLLLAPLQPLQAMELLLINSPQVRAQLAALGIAQAQRLQAGMINNPTLALGALRPEGGGRWQLDAGISQSILDWFTRPLRNTLAETQLATTQLELHAYLHRQLFNAQSLYYNALAAQQLSEIRHLQMQSAEANYSLAQSLYEAGNIPERRLLQYRLEVQAQERQWQQAQLAAQLSRIALANLLGLKPNLKMQLPDNLPLLPAQDNFSSDALYQHALAQRVDLQLARLHVQTAEQKLALQKKAGAFTELELGANIERETDGNYRAGPEVAFSLPLFDRGHARRFGAEAAIIQARELLTAQELQVENDIASALLALADARMRAEQIQTHSLPLQREMQALQLREYNFMLASAFELIALKRQEFELQEDYVDALLSYWLARSELALASGQSLLPDPELKARKNLAPDINETDTDHNPHIDHSMHHGDRHHD